MVKMKARAELYNTIDQNFKHQIFQFYFIDNCSMTQTTKFVNEILQTRSIELGQPITAEMLQGRWKKWNAKWKISKTNKHGSLGSDRGPSLEALEELDAQPLWYQDPKNCMVLGLPPPHLVRVPVRDRWARRQAYDSRISDHSSQDAVLSSNSTTTQPSWNGGAFSNQTSFDHPSFDASFTFPDSGRSSFLAAPVQTIDQSSFSNPTVPMEIEQNMQSYPASIYDDNRLSKSCVGGQIRAPTSLEPSGWVKGYENISLHSAAPPYQPQQLAAAIAPQCSLHDSWAGLEGYDFL